MSKYVARIEVVLDKEFDFNAKDLTEAYREAGKIVASTQWKNFFLSFNLKNVTVTRVNEEDEVREKRSK